MGADLYNNRYTNTQPALVEAKAESDRLVVLMAQADGEERETLRQKWCASYDISNDSLSYFRDSYNDSSVLWQLGLSWWKDLPQIEYSDEQREAFDESNSWPDISVSAKHCREFFKLVKSRKVLFEANLKEMPDEETREYFIEKYNRLIAFLTQGIKDGGIDASV